MRRCEYLYVLKVQSKKYTWKTWEKIHKKLLGGVAHTTIFYIICEKRTNDSRWIDNSKITVVAAAVNHEKKRWKKAKNWDEKPASNKNLCVKHFWKYRLCKMTNKPF